MNMIDLFLESLDEDTVKQGSSWVNKGEEGTHGKFKTKADADAQRKAMFAQGYKEDIEEQPDMFDKELSDFHSTDENTDIKVIRNEKDSKDYIFDQDSSNFIDELIRDPSDDSQVVEILADAYLRNDEFANILKNANKEDRLVFNTSKNGKIVIDVARMFEMLPYLKREMRYEESSDEDWLNKWNENKVRYESKVKDEDLHEAKDESYIEYVKRLQNFFMD